MLLQAVIAAPRLKEPRRLNSYLRDGAQQQHLAWHAEICTLVLPAPQVMLHQTVIGEEALEQLALVGEKPDVLVGCTGGGRSGGRAGADH